MATLCANPSGRSKYTAHRYLKDKTSYPTLASTPGKEAIVLVGLAAGLRWDIVVAVQNA